MEDKQVEVFEYRGFSFPIYLDDYGQQYYTIFDGEELGFGAYNTGYREDLMYLVDSKLDTIKKFDRDSEAFGGVVEYFFNGTGRDIRVSYRSRILKVYICLREPSETTLARILVEAENLILKFKKLQNDSLYSIVEDIYESTCN